MSRLIELLEDDESGKLATSNALLWVVLFADLLMIAADSLPSIEISHELFLTYHTLLLPYLFRQGKKLGEALAKRKPSPVVTAQNVEAIDARPTA